MFTILCLLVAYIPFQIALNPAAGVDLASGRVFILLLFLLWIFWGLKNRKLKIANNLITYFLLAFLFFAGLSCFWADAPDRALRKLAVFLSIFPLYFIVVSLVDSRKKLERVLQCIIWPAVVLALIGIGQFVLQFFVGIEPIMRFWSSKIAFIFWGRSFGAEVISNPSWLANVGGATYLRAFSLFPDPHMFSFYLGLVIPIAIGIGITNLELRIKNEVSGSKKKISNIKCQISNQCQKGEMSNKKENKKAKKQEEKIEQQSVIPARIRQLAEGIQSFNSHSEVTKNPVDCRVRSTHLALTKNDGILRWPLRMTGVIIILVIAQILTFSRGGYVGFALFLLFLFVIFLKKIFLYVKTVICHSREGGNPVLIRILSCLFVIGILSVFFTNNPVQQRFVSIFNSRDGSNMGRIEIWKQSLSVSEDHFWTGVGIGNYSFYLEPRYGYRTPIYAHNTYLDILSEMGILGLVSYLLLIISAVVYLLISDKVFSKNAKLQIPNDKQIQNSNNKNPNSLKFALAGSLIWFSGHAFFDTPIYSPTVLPFLIIILGLISCLSYYHLE